MRDLFFLTSGISTAPAPAVRPLPAPSQLLATAKAWRSRGLSRLLSNTVAVVVRDSGDVALVDAGWSSAVCADAPGVLGRARATTLGVALEPKDAIVEQLARLGIDRAQVKTIVATHLHLDHVGGVDDFPDAEVVCTERELAAYRRFPRDLGYRAEDLARAGRVRTVVLDGTPTYGFAGSLDLFADGDVVLLDARGHTPGLAAVAMRTGTECFVHVGDAVYQSWEYGLAPAGPCLIARMTSWRTRVLRQTYGAIRSCEADPRKPMIVPSHDMGVYERLPHAPSA